MFHLVRSTFRLKTEWGDGGARKDMLRNLTQPRLHRPNGLEAERIEASRHVTKVNLTPRPIYTNLRDYMLLTLIVLLKIKSLGKM